MRGMSYKEWREREWVLRGSGDRAWFEDEWQMYTQEGMESRYSKWATDGFRKRSKPYFVSPGVWREYGELIGQAKRRFGLKPRGVYCDRGRWTCVIRFRMKTERVGWFETREQAEAASLRWQRMNMPWVKELKS